MPIAVMCPSCSASFSVKDELASKRAKCPKCGEPLTIPGGAPAAPAPVPAVAKPVAARPVAAPVKPADDGDDRPRSQKRRDDEEEDQPKAKRPRDEDDGDDRPRGKRRRDQEEDERPKGRKRREDDADDDEPRGKRRRDDDDDQPKKKSKALPIVLGILGGLVLLCGGGCGGFYWFVIKPAGEQLQAMGSEFQSEVEKNKQNQNKQRPTEEPPAVTMAARDFANLKDTDRKQYEKKWVQLTGPVPTVHIDSYPNKPEDGWIELGSARIATVMCEFGPTEWAAKPKFDDEKEYTVIGYCDAGSFSPKLKWCRVTGESGGAETVPVATLLSDPAKYKGKRVEVSGVIQTAGALALGGEASFVEKSGGMGLMLTFGPLEWRKIKLAPGDTVTVRGTPSAVPTGGFVFMSGCDVVKHTPGNGTRPQDPPSDPNAPVVTTDDAMIQAFIRDITSPDRMYKGKQVKLTGKVADVNGPILSFGGKVDSNFTHWVQVSMSGPTGVKKGDTVTVVGKYKEYSSSFQNGTRTITLTDGKVEGAVGVAPAPKPETPPKPDTPPAEVISVKAEDLAAEFDKDATAATKKYQDKTVTVTGSVEQVTPTGSVVTLKGLAAAGTKKAIVVTVQINPELREESKKLKAGDAVKLTGKFTILRGATGNRPAAVSLTNGLIDK